MGTDKITVYDIQMTAPWRTVADGPHGSADMADVEEGWIYDTWAEASTRIDKCMLEHPGALVLVGQREMTREEYASLGPDPDPLPTSTDYQQNVAAWAHACFGQEHATDPLERADRFCEEALELLQAASYDPLRVRALLDYVYNRPAGRLAQEVGGVLVTLAAFCAAHGVRMEAQGDWELARVWANLEKIRAKHAAKPRGSALPGTVPVPVPQDWPQQLAGIADRIAANCVAISGAAFGLQDAVRAIALRELATLHDADARRLLLQLVLAARGTDDERLVAVTEKAEALLGLDVVQAAERDPDKYASWMAAQAGLAEVTHGRRGSGWGDRVPRQWPDGMADALRKVPPITPDMSPAQVSAVRDMLTLIVDNAQTASEIAGLRSVLEDLDTIGRQEDKR
jgi:hypothetical protein